eukprot:CAMPEP_0198213364 /NCGR_PEP_ID=MMETSP1445-20131203/28820_1 /TAXON_ID=36898 /ORGANISM="Pyramimonas sp., Strain CCMP2087" /LENGTH=181 /DNA_ID=CAMNT_0043887991 /DNA_START=938 /DNA_END=1483 /DNA_ORIENTATION=-
MSTEGANIPNIPNIPNPQLVLQQVVVPARRCKSSEIIQETFTEPSRNIQAIFKQHSGNIQFCPSLPTLSEQEAVVGGRIQPSDLSFWMRNNSRNPQETLKEHSVNIQGTFHVQGTFRERSGKNPKVVTGCQKFTRIIVNQSMARCRKNAPQEFLDCIQSNYAKQSMALFQQAVNGWHARNA